MVQLANIPVWLWLSVIPVAVLGYLAYVFCLWLLLSRCIKRPVQPGPITVTLKEEPMAGTLVYNVNLPAGGQDDVVKRVLTVTVNGNAEVHDLANDVSAFEIKVPQGASVSLRLVNVDDAGNPSTPAEQTFLAQDTIPPDAPGAFGEITLIREE